MATTPLLTAGDAAADRWWTRRHGARDVTDREQRWLADLALMLDDLRPPQVDPALCAVVAAASLIVLVPHRSLGGLTLVATVTSRFIAISWASISDFEAHDDLDLAREVYLFTPDEDDEALRHRAVIGVRDQLCRPVILRMRATRLGVPLSASCYLGGAGGQLRRIATLPPRAARWRCWWPFAVRVDREIRFTDRTPPPYAVPSFAGAWFRADAPRRAERAADPPRRISAD